MRTRSLPLAHQRGAATLIVAIILLLALTLATFSAARIGVTEQRSVANDVRAKQAFWVAQGGVEQGIAFLNANKALISSTAGPAALGPPPIERGWEYSSGRWDMCADSISPPCGDGFTTHASSGPAPPLSWASYILEPPQIKVSDHYNFSLHFLVPKSQTGKPPPINPTVIVTATVQRAGGDALRGLTGVGTDVLRVSQMVKGYDTLVGLSGSNYPSIDAPLMVKGSVKLEAGVSVWGNVSPNLPYATKPYVPFVPFPVSGTLSIWSRGAVTLTSTAKTCNHKLKSKPDDCDSLSYDGHDGGDNATCVRHPLDTDGSLSGCAVVVSANTTPPAFPPDLFYYVFGVANDRFQRVRNDATVLKGCSTLGGQPSGFYWVQGNCAVTTNVGGTSKKFTAPITLVVNGGKLTLGAGVNFWGTVYLRGSTLELPVGARPTLHGALISDGDLAVTVGVLDLFYDPDVLRTDSARAGGFAKVLGGWRDAAQ